jgi:hypothetical protein
MKTVTVELCHEGVAYINQHLRAGETFEDYISRHFASLAYADRGMSRGDYESQLPAYLGRSTWGVKD